LEALQTKWNEFTSWLKEEGREFDYNALVQDFHLEAPHKIVLKLPNKSQQVAIDNIKQELLGFLRESLQNSHIDLECEVIKQKEENLIYTNKEKFEYLARKYPHLTELKRRLDLDTEF